MLLEQFFAIQVLRPTWTEEHKEVNIEEYHRAHGRPIGNVERTVTHTCLAATQAGAIAARPFVGKRKKNAADGAAVQAMEEILRNSEYPGEISIGEGEADKAPGLHHGQRFGYFPPDLDEPVVYYAADPIEGTTLLANGADNAVCVLAACLNGYGSIKRGPDRYVNTVVLPKYMSDPLLMARKQRKVVRGVPRAFDLDAPLLRQPFDIVIQAMAAFAKMRPEDIAGEALDRPRNAEMIELLLKAGGSQRLIQHGDIMTPVRVHQPRYKDVNIGFGIGGSAEAAIRGVITLTYGGYMELEPWIDPEDDQAQQIADFTKHDYEIDRVYSLEEITSGMVVFSITAITNTGVMNGISIDPSSGWLHSSSLYGRSSTGSVYTSHGDHTKPPKRS